MQTATRSRPRECSSGRHGREMWDDVPMKFYVSTAFLETSEVVEIAKAADDLGYDGMGIPDHVINLETLKTPYPYTKDGKRRWEAFTEWPDPWVMIGAIALVTTRLHFVTTCICLPCAIRTLPRNPLARRHIWLAADWNSASALASARKSSR